MKVVIFAGGMGTRISEESHVRPKPMIEIGNRPILWHIMKLYSHYGLREFIICLGFKGYMVKEYFANYYLHSSDVTFDLATNSMKIHQTQAENWKVTLVDTGLETMTGGRLKRAGKYLSGDTFCLTYGDGVGDIAIDKLLRFHRESGLMATVTATRPPARFGALDLSNGDVAAFTEKPVGDGGWINGGFFVLSRRVIDLIDGDDTVWEKAPLERLAALGQLGAYKHQGFWQPMDTMRDKMYLDGLWQSGKAAWAVWNVKSEAQVLAGVNGTFDHRSEGEDGAFA